MKDEVAVKKIVHCMRFASPILAVLCLGALACACDKDQGGSASSASSASAPVQTPAVAKPAEDPSFKIGLLLPDAKTARYEAADRPYFTQRLAEICPKCEVLYQNADQKADQQQTQAESMLTNGVKALVIDAVDAKAAGALVTNAKSKNVPVLAYERLAQGPVDYFVSFDSERVGRLQGEALLEALQKGGDPKRGKIVVINGSPTDPNAAAFKKGMHAALDGKVSIGLEYDTPDWSPDVAQKEMDQAITALGKNAIIGVYCANDGTASGAIAAMKGAGFTQSKWPPVTGQDADIAAIQRIVAGQQYMTVYKAIKKEARVAAEIAYAMVQGKPYTEGHAVPIDNGTKPVPAILLEAQSVTKDKVKDTVVQDGFYTTAQICTEAFAPACKIVGIL